MILLISTLFYYLLRACDIVTTNRTFNMTLKPFSDAFIMIPMKAIQEDKIVPYFEFFMANEAFFIVFR